MVSIFDANACVTVGLKYVETEIIKCCAVFKLVFDYKVLSALARYLRADLDACEGFALSVKDEVTVSYYVVLG